MEVKTHPKYPVLALGFRPFFGLAGLFAILLVLLWNVILKGHGVSGNYFTPVYWHAHEMLLGYTTAVIAGFLLTAVRNWTGLPTPDGNTLAGLCMLWFCGRIAPFFAGLFPDNIIALTDLAFLPFLTYFIAKPILAAKLKHNLVFPVLLFVLFCGNGLVHLEMLGIKENTAWLGLHISVATVVILILVIAGRVLPFFTERGLLGISCPRKPVLDHACVLSAITVFGLIGFGVTGAILALASLLTAIVNSARFYGWYTPKIWHVPLLWVLYTGYGWIILGFALTVFSAYGLIPPTLSVHAFTVGGIGVMTLGMMARVALGHTGRELLASKTMAIGFVVINMAAVIRVILPVLAPNWFAILIDLSMLAWLVAFSFFIYEYGPILTSPRIDGKEG